MDKCIIAVLVGLCFLSVFAAIILYQVMEGIRLGLKDFFLDPFGYKKAKENWENFKEEKKEKWQNFTEEKKQNWQNFKERNKEKLGKYKRVWDNVKESLPNMNVEVTVAFDPVSEPMPPETHFKEIDFTNKDSK